MNRRNLNKIKLRLLELQQSPNGHKPTVFIALAKKVGRVKSKRGKEPTWVRMDSPELSPPLSIPNHNVVKTGTARNIVFMLLSDCDEWEIYLNEERT